jgi:RHS repeat-associated protein
VLAWSGPSSPLGGVIATATSLMVSDGALVRGVGVNADGSALSHVFHLDNQGSVQALSSGSQGVERDYETDAWGNLLTVNTSDNRAVYLGGLGYWQEPALGLSYVRARWMDPMTGRWLSVDPVPTEPRYLYAHNSPTMRVDPSGLKDNLFQQREHFLGGVPGRIGGWWDRETAEAGREISALAGEFGSIVDKVSKTLLAHLPELQQFAMDPETAAKALILHKTESVWRSAVDVAADQAVKLGINHIPDVVARNYPLSVGLSRSEWERSRHQFESLAPFLVPYPLSSRWIYWTGGFTWGLVKAAVEMIPPITPAAQASYLTHTGQSLTHAFWAIYDALQKKGLVRAVKEALKAARDGFVNFFEDAVHKSAFDQGKLTGIIVANIVATVLLIATVVGGIAAAVRYIKLGGSVSELIGAYRAGGLKLAKETFLERDPTKIYLRDGTTLIKPEKGPASGQAGKPSPITIHAPSEGGGLVPRDSGHPVAASHNPTARAQQQIDAITRRMLAGEAQMRGVSAELKIRNWSWKSEPTWGHSFKEHGAGPKQRRALTGRAAGTSTPQGQWLNNDAAAKFLRPFGGVNGPATILKIPMGLGQVIRPDGTIVQASKAFIKPSAGGFVTAFPIE